jgi:hypothetical protein
MLLSKKLLKKIELDFECLEGDTSLLWSTRLCDRYEYALSDFVRVTRKEMVLDSIE